jgi:GNAT superfamily N-acetyltransferase
VIEIRTYEGGASELSTFIREVWNLTYKGRMPFPLWSARYFEWQLLVGRARERDLLVAAYDGTKLVGCLMAEPCRFRLHGREIAGSTASWTTVHPDYRRAGIGVKLAVEQQRRHLDRGLAVYAGFLARTPTSLGAKFWLAYPDTVALPTVGFWARVLDHRAVARWELSRHTALGTRALGWLQSRPSAADVNDIRPYRSADLPACLRLAEVLLTSVHLGYVWSAERLARQLGDTDMPRTLIAERAGEVAGFVNYYRLDLMAKHSIEAAIIDLVAFGRLSPHDQTRLLQAALADMVREGVKVAIMLRLPCYPSRPMLAAGFLPAPMRLTPVGVRADRTLSLEGVRRLYLPFH